VFDVGNPLLGRSKLDNSDKFRSGSESSAGKSGNWESMLLLGLKAKIWFRKVIEPADRITRMRTIILKGGT
jgi:hypothetical protein